MVAHGKDRAGLACERGLHLAQGQDGIDTRRKEILQRAACAASRGVMVISATNR